MVTRLPSRGPVSAYKTYRIAAPLATHYRTGLTCAQYECDAYLLGWQSQIDEGTELGQRQAAFIRKRSGRKFTEHRTDAGLTVFSFEPGQEGFASSSATEPGHGNHRKRLDRPEVYIERAGDHRGNPTGMRQVHTRPEFWVESFAENQARLAALKKRG
jgi:hypothetical protein